MTTIHSKNLDHLGLVAQMYDELEIGQVIDRMIKQDTSQRNVSIGQAVKAMVLNGLGFVNRALYLFPDFFSDKPTDRLLGKDILPEHLNDDTLGRALDALYTHDVTALFGLIASHACKKLSLNKGFIHLDSTSFHVDGQYEAEGSDEKTLGVEICSGYSRDHRPDLKQVMLNLIVENKAGIPLAMRALSGNSSDKVSFGEMIEAHVDQLNHEHAPDYWVADSALYTHDNLELLKNHHCKWITRVPETLSLAQTECAKAEGRTELLPGYSYRRSEVEYAGVKQRWLVLVSPESLARAGKAAQKKLAKKGAAEWKLFEQLKRKRFACEEDAKKELALLEQTVKLLKMNESQILTEEKKGRIIWRIESCVFSEAECLWSLLLKEASFILATNELDEQRLSDREILEAYKDQQKVERGFRFLKDPRFQANTLFLKSKERIEALLMVMTLCLMVYAALEYRLRESLKEKGHSDVVDQKGKPTQIPTMRWIFQVFTGIHVLYIEDKKESMLLNMNNHHHAITGLLGEGYKALYC